jgi:hypothetical protein
MEAHHRGRPGKERDVFQKKVAGQGMLCGPLLLESEQVQPLVKRKGADVVQCARDAKVPEFRAGKTEFLAQAEGEVCDPHAVVGNLGAHQVQSLRQGGEKGPKIDPEIFSLHAATPLRIRHAPILAGSVTLRWKPLPGNPSFPYPPSIVNSCMSNQKPLWPMESISACRIFMCISSSLARERNISFASGSCAFAARSR